jgi:ParB family chromosome partitioning protein
MFSQGKRNDILEQIKMLGNPHGDRENGTSSQVAKKLTTIEKVGVAYSLSKDTVARYLRIHQLIPALKSRLDSGGIKFIPAVTLSFLNEAEQTLVDDCMKLNKFFVDMKKADALRQYSEKGKLDGDAVYLILSGEATAKKPTASPSVKINKAVYAKYFQPDQSSKEVQAIVEKALDLYFEQEGADA